MVNDSSMGGAVAADLRSLPRSEEARHFVVSSDTGYSSAAGGNLWLPSGVRDGTLLEQYRLGL